MKDFKFRFVYWVSILFLGLLMFPFSVCVNSVLCMIASGGILFISAIQLFRVIKHKKDKEYIESMEVARNDERNQYINSKAWTLSSYVIIMLQGLCAMVAGIMSNIALMTFSLSFALSFLIIYLIVYMILSKVY